MVATKYVRFSNQNMTVLKANVCFLELCVRVCDN